MFRDLLTRHLKLKGGDCCHGEAEFGSSTSAESSQFVGAETTQVQVLNMQPTTHEEASIAVSKSASPSRQDDAGNQNVNLACDLPRSSFNGISSQLMQLPASATLTPDTSPQFLDESLHDLQLLWGSMDADFSREESFPYGIPNELIFWPGLDVPEPTYSRSLGPHISPTSRESRSSSPHSEDDASLCDYRLPSLQQEDEGDSQVLKNTSHRQGPSTGFHEASGAGIPWRISKACYQTVVEKFDQVRDILPESFALPSKYVFCRYIEGFFTGSHEHLPFLHFPTVSVACITPPLILAIIAMGAKYRFERDRAISFYRASKTLVEHHIRLYTESSLQPRGSQIEYVTEETKIEILQAQIILTTLGVWSAHDLLHDSFSMAGQMSLYLRSSGLLSQDGHCNDGTWRSLVQEEGRRRTKFIAYMLCNIQTILHNTPTKIMNSEITSLYLPWPEELWRASSPAEWKTLRSKWSANISFGDGYTRLFQLTSTNKEDFSLSSFGNLILIHAVFQQIYLARESEVCHSMSTGGQSATFSPEVLAKFHSALHRWQKSWQISSDPSITPSSPNGPLGFNATAIFRIACIRLHINLGPHRSLGTGDPERIAYAFLNAPLPAQTPKVYHAVLQSIHALSIPVRLGIEYVAKTQTLTWSTIHSLCNFECALFLCKWLETLALDPSSLHHDERRLLRMIISVLREADLTPVGNNMAEIGSKQLHLIGAVLIRLLSEIMKGTHVFEGMDILCEALQIYANLLESNLNFTREKQIL